MGCSIIILTSLQIISFTARIVISICRFIGELVPWVKYLLSMHDRAALFEVTHRFIVLTRVEVHNRTVQIVIFLVEDVLFIIICLLILLSHSYGSLTLLVTALGNSGILILLRHEDLLRGLLQLSVQLGHLPLIELVFFVTYVVILVHGVFLPWLLLYSEP